VKNQIELILVHGWGFESGCWEDWQKLAGLQLTEQPYERGYFGRRNQLESLPPPQGRRVVVAHSLGAHFLTPELLAKTELLVLVASFGQYHDGFTDQRRSRATTEAMRRKVIRSPLMVVADFHTRCGYKTAFIADSSTFNTDLLAADLELLDQHRIDAKILANIPKVLLLHGGNDEINPISNSELLRDALPGSVLKVHPDAPHALPFTHSNWCIDAINEFVPLRADVSTPA